MLNALTFFAEAIFGFISIVILVLSVLYWKYRKNLDILHKARKDTPRDVDGPDIIVVGAGICGASLAAVLARDGRRITLVEKSMAPPDTLRGEVMLFGGLRAMESLGIEVSHGEINGTIANNIHIHDPMGNIIGFHHPRCAMVFEHGRLVEVLRRRAAYEERCTVIEGTVTGLLQNGDLVTGVRYRDKKDGITKELTAPLTIIAEGRYSKHRGINIPLEPQLDFYYTGFEVSGDVKTDSFNLWISAYGLTAQYSMSEKDIRIGLTSRVKRSQKELIDFANHVPKDFIHLYKRSLVEGRVRTVAVYHLPPSIEKSVRGVVTLGDAFSTRTPMAASGMTCLLKDIETWQNLFKNIPDLYNYEATKAALELFLMSRFWYAFSIDLLGRCINRFFCSTSGEEAELGVTFGEQVAQDTDGLMNFVIGKDTRPLGVLYQISTIVGKAMNHAVKKEDRLHLGIYRAINIFFSACSICIPIAWYHIKCIMMSK